MNISQVGASSILPINDGNVEMKQDLIQVTGVLVPDQWEEDGEISGLALLTNDESKYVINCSDLENDIMPLLRKKIEISGLLKSKAREKTILVTEFRPVSC